MGHLLRKIIYIAGMLLLATRLGSAQDAKPQLTVHGYAAYEAGEIVHGSYGGGDKPIEHEWMNRVFSGFNFNVDYDENLEAHAGLEGELWNPFESEPNQTFRRRYFNIYINEAEGIYSVGGKENPLLQLTAGYFPYKYNHDGRNFGDYLFRTMTYPGFIFNDFDFPVARVLGFRLNNNLLDSCLHQDLLLTSASEHFPFYDFSLTYQASYTAAKCLEIGAGIQFDRFISVNSNKTTPKTDVFSGGQNNDDRYINYHVNNGDTVGADTSYYTFAGTKLMGRVAIDLKRLIPGELVPLNIFGPEDFRLYAEGAVLGLKDYPLFYDNIAKRIPIMFGFNLPVFKLLDVLSMEFEYYDCPYPANYQNVEQAATPVPYVTRTTYNPDNYKDADWKYSFYAKRTFKKYVTFTGQISRDHFRTLFSDGNTDFEETMTHKSDWAFFTKIGISF